MAKLRGDMSPEELEHKRKYNVEYQRKRRLEATEEEREESVKKVRENQKKRFPFSPSVYCVHTGWAVVKVGSESDGGRSHLILSHSDPMYRHLYFRAKFETRRQAMLAEKGAHDHLEFRVKLHRFPCYKSVKASELFSVEDMGFEWLESLKFYLADQPGFKHFEIYNP